MWRHRVAGIGALLASLACSDSDLNAQGGRTVVLVSIDTLRADALSSYGNQRSTSPYLDKLAENGVRFASAFAPSPWTIPSHVTMLTALEPGVLPPGAQTPVPETLVTLAERLREGGFATGAVVNFHFLNAKRGFAQGFDEFTHHVNRSDATGLVDTALSFIERHASENQFFFLHLFDVHAPYDHPAPFGGRFTDDLKRDPDSVIPFLRKLRYHEQLRLERVPNLAWLRAQYEEGVTRVDSELGRLFGSLRRLGLYDESLVIITSDHGEAFFERGVWVGHGLFPYESEIRIPLIIKFPERYRTAGVVSPHPAGLVDVAPTILHSMGLPSLPKSQGRSLLRVVRSETGEESEDPATAPAVFGVSTHFGQPFVRTRRWKLIAEARVPLEQALQKHLHPDAEALLLLQERIDIGEQLYDLESDPREAHNLVHIHKDVAAQLRKRLQAKMLGNAALRKALDLRPSVGPLGFTEEERRLQRALGYAE